MYYMGNTLGKYFDILNLSLFLSHFLFLFEDPATDGLVNRLKFPSQHFLNWPWVFTHTRRHAHAHKVMCWFVTRYRREEHLFSLHPQYTHTCSLKNYKQIHNARTHLIFSLALSLCAWSMLWVPPLCDCVCVCGVGHRILRAFLSVRHTQTQQLWAKAMWCAQDGS